MCKASSLAEIERDGVTSKVHPSVRSSRLAASAMQGVFASILVRGEGTLEECRPDRIS